MAPKHSARRQKLKDVKAVWNNKETGEGEILKHTRPKPIDAKQPTESKIDSLTTKITSGSAAGAQTSEGSTTGTAARFFVVGHSKQSWWQWFSVKKFKCPFHRTL